MRSLIDLFIQRWAAVKYNLKKSSFAEKDIASVFDTIYHTNHWKNEESRSGPGSTVEYMKDIIPQIQIFLETYSIRSILDIPCGDFNWAQHLMLDGITYIGADIVPDLIKKNIDLFSSQNIHFHKLDLTKDTLPKADLILVRDCLVHFSFADINLAIQNIKSSGATYLMTTSFNTPTDNFNIHTGDWRPLNLMVSPFYFPSPIYSIEEKLPEKYKRFDKGKILGVWPIKAL